MKIFRLFLAVIVVQTLTVVAQSFEVHGRNTLLRRKRLVTLNNGTCSTQQLKSPVDGAILKTPQEGNSISFHHGDKADFVCKDGYQQVGQLKSFICQEDGKWNESTSNRSGFCAKTDEVSCGPTVLNVTGRATGILTSTTINRHPPSKTVDCTWSLVTEDPGFYIKLLFVNFSLSPNCTNNFISLEKVNFTDFGRTKKCCNSQSENVCRFSGKSSPPLSRSVSHSMTVKFYSKDLSKSFFKAIWYNVNGLYPNGLVPQRDLTYAPRIVLPMPSQTTIAPDTPSVLAFTVFALILFAVGVFIACKFGKRYLGLSCSLGDCWALVTCRWTSRAPSIPYRTREGPSEARGLMTDTDSPLTGERIRVSRVEQI
ncbi:uncharacterized protein LOC110046258 [Orbicella faveolata]|uniref:uncharacterized protein LOC110046258 n=1 Tax=Orbicella faveolata TaxID=48498 RepID=UPI0009E5FE21|nr:uncharacterized protein LOC110046258 [Orbicella faveolata]